MKHLYLIDEHVSSAGNGIGTFLRELIGCLKRMEVSVCLVVFNAECREFTIEEREGIRYFLFPEFTRGEFISHPSIVDYFFRLYIDDSPENVFCINHSPCVELMRRIRESHPLSKILFTIHDLAWTGLLSGDSVKLKKIISGRSEPDMQEKYRGLLNVFDEEKQMCDAADKVICLSPSTFRLLTDVYKVDKEQIYCIPNGLTKDDCGDGESRRHLRETYLITTEEKIILFVGRLNRMKGFTALVDAFGDILKEHPRARLVLAGNISSNAFPVLPDTVVASRITYLGQVKPCELKKWYRMADVGVISSYSEQCSYVGIEMMMYGLPVISSDAFGVRDMFRDGMNARIAAIGSYGDPQLFRRNLSNAIIEVLSSAKLAKQISDGARAVYESRYTPYEMQRNYENLLHNI